MCAYELAAEARRRGPLLVGHNDGRREKWALLEVVVCCVTVFMSGVRVLLVPRREEYFAGEGEGVRQSGRPPGTPRTAAKRSVQYMCGCVCIYMSNEMQKEKL